MKDVVQSVDRALSILELLADHDEGLGTTEIGSLLDLHKSTVHRLLGTLIYKDYVTQDQASRKYKTTYKLYELGSKILGEKDLLSVSKQHTEELMKKINEVVHLVVRDGIYTVYIDKVEADNTIRMASTIGRRAPLYSTSVGKAMMAYMPLEKVDAIWKDSQVEKFTPNTIDDYGEFLEELEKVSKLGYAEDDEENEMGVRCLGAPIFNRTGQVEGAISISGPTIRVTKTRAKEIGPIVRRYADRISRELGYLGDKAHEV